MRDGGGLDDHAALARPVKGIQLRHFAGHKPHGIISARQVDIDDLYEMVEIGGAIPPDDSPSDEDSGAIDQNARIAGLGERGLDAGLAGDVALNGGSANF